MLGKDQTINVDRFSNLPWDVVDGILVRIPFKEAVKTSILSSKWRRKWTRLSQIVIDDTILQATTLDKHARWRQIAGILKQFQLGNGAGPIEKFKLAAYCSPDHQELLQWVAFLVGNGLKELVIKAFVSSTHFDLPLHAFSCRHLSRLDLSGCAIEIPDGSAFEEFSSLASLKLSSVRIDDYTLQDMISRCSVLESLTLLELDDCIYLSLHRTKLKYLKISSSFDDICLLDNPSLCTVDIDMRGPLVFSSMHSDSSLVRIIGYLRGLKRLALTNKFIEFLGKKGVPERLPSLLGNLTVLELRDVRADNLNHFTVGLCLLRSAPNLEELHISESRSFGPLKAVFAQFDAETGLYFNRLKVVKLTGGWSISVAKHFLKLILARSPMLETLTVIQCNLYKRIPDELLKELRQEYQNVKIISLISASFS